MMVLLLAAGLRSVFVPPGDDDLDERLERVEAQLKDIAARPPPASVAPKALDDLTARVARLEQAPPRGADAAVDKRLSALEAAARSTADGLAKLDGRVDETAAALRGIRGEVEAAAKASSELERQAAPQPSDVTRADLDQLGRRIAALEAATASLKDAAAKAAEPVEPDRPIRVAVLALALESAVERGAPYAAELAALRAFGADATKLEALQPFAASGVPSLAALSSELPRPAPKAPGTSAGTSAGAVPGDGGFLDRLRANAERLGRFRSINETQGDQPGAVLARMQAKVAQGDVAGALADIPELPADARAGVDDWAKKAAARQAAVAAAQALSASSLAALGRSGSQGGQQK
jgi:hypothetical protein